MLTSLQTTPYALQLAEARHLCWRGTQVAVMASSTQTGGAFNVFQVRCLPQAATSLHIHYAEDVSIYVLNGALTFFWGDERRSARAGAYFFQPRGTPHGFRVEGDQPAHLLYLTVPAGLDRFVFEHAVLFPNSELAVAAARYQIEIVGPLPA